MKRLLPLVAALLAVSSHAYAYSLSNLTSSERARAAQHNNDQKYIDTYGFLEDCRRAESGALAPISLPVQPQDYDPTIVTAAEQKIVDDAVFKAVLALLGG